MHLFHTPRLAAPALALLLTAFAHAPARAAEPRVSLSRHAAQATALRGARLMDRLAPATPLHFALTLPLRNQADLDALLLHQYTPGDPLYGHFLTSDEFVARFGPTEEDYRAVAAWAQSQGLTVTGTHTGRTTLDVAGSAAQVESAFAIRMNHYQTADGRVVFANSGAPRVTRSVAARLAGVAGLSDVSRMRPLAHRLRPGAVGLRPALPVGGGGTGAAGGLTPNDIKYAYDLSGVTPLYGSAATTTGTTTLLDGKGQTVGLFELDSFAQSDINLFISQYSLPSVPYQAATATAAAVLGTVKPVSVDNFNLASTTFAGTDEVTLDIDMVLALAPNATSVYSYEGNQGTTALTFNPAVPLDIFQRMADDTALDGSGKPLLQVISDSWGVPEIDEDPAVRAGENTIFQKMAAQGQSVFCATGDEGAYDRYPVDLSLRVDSPGSQPFVTAVGGTTLTYSKPTTSTTTGALIPGSYVSESAWKTGTVNNPTGPEGGGGGTSDVWPKPSYQVGLGHSATNRDVPDVALDADPATGYDIYYNGVAVTYGGTSAAAPLWAAFAALVNEQRGLNGLATTLGFANPTLYALGQGTSYTTLFHDVTLGDNLFYSATVGYDDATGFGSFIGAPLITALSANADQGTGPATLNGTITDTSGNPVAGATVTATSAATGAVKATTTTDTTGAYTLTVPGGLVLTVTVDTSTVVTAAGGTHYASPTPVSLTLTAGTTTTQNFALAAAFTFASGLQMISAPYDFTGLGDFATLFGLTTPLANPNPRLIQWEPSLGVYVFYPTAPADTLRLGQGYWIKFPTATYLHRLGVPASLTQSYRIPLTAGWNQIGDPFLGSVPLSTVTADTAVSSGAVPLTAAASPVQSNLFRYDPTAGAYVAVDPTAGTLDPFNGYWIFAKQAAVLIVPPVAGPPPPPGGSPTPPPAPGG